MYVLMTGMPKKAHAHTSCIREIAYKATDLCILEEKCIKRYIDFHNNIKKSKRDNEEREIT